MSSCPFAAAVRLSWPAQAGTHASQAVRSEWKLQQQNGTTTARSRLRQVRKWPLRESILQGSIAATAGVRPKPPVGSAKLVRSFQLRLCAALCVVRESALDLGNCNPVGASRRSAVVQPIGRELVRIGGQAGPKGANTVPDRAARPSPHARSAPKQDHRASTSWPRGAHRASWAVSIGGPPCLRVGLTAATVITDSRTSGVRGSTSTLRQRRRRTAR